MLELVSPVPVLAVSSARVEWLLLLLSAAAAAPAEASNRNGGATTRLGGRGDCISGSLRLHAIRLEAPSDGRKSQRRPCSVRRRRSRLRPRRHLVAVQCQLAAHRLVPRAQLCGGRLSTFDSVGRCGRASRRRRRSDQRQFWQAARGASPPTTKTHLGESLQRVQFEQFIRFV